MLSDIRSSCVGCSPACVRTLRHRFSNSRWCVFGRGSLDVTAAVVGIASLDDSRLVDPDEDARPAEHLMKDKQDATDADWCPRCSCQSCVKVEKLEDFNEEEAF
jgi:hypothetical protein